MSHFNPDPFGMISKYPSFKLELTTLEGELVWEFAPRKDVYSYPAIRAINEKHKIPNQQALKDVLSSFHQIEQWDLEQIQSFGSEACQNILPPKLIEELREYDEGYILFLVPPHAADIPFEFFFIPEKGFLCLIFQTSICINYVSQRNRYQQTINRNLRINRNHKFLIISNPDDDQTIIHNEVQEVKNFVKNNHFGTYSIATSNKEILCEEIIKNSIIHFASRSLDTGNRNESGWELSSSTIFNINNIEQMLYNTKKIPSLIFSNSCDAGLFGSSKHISGIAASFLKGGVENYIGPILKVNTQESLEFALLFYKYFFCNKSPVKALFLAKKEMLKRNPSSITPFFYRVYGDHRVVKPPNYWLKISIGSFLLSVIILLIYIFPPPPPTTPSLEIITDFTTEELLVYESVTRQFEKENNITIDINNIRSQVPTILRKYKKGDIIHIDINKINSINLEKHFLNISDYLNELIPTSIDPGVLHYIDKVEKLQKSNKHFLVPFRRNIKLLFVNKQQYFDLTGDTISHDKIRLWSDVLDLAEKLYASRNQAEIILALDSAGSSFTLEMLRATGDEENDFEFSIIKSHNALDFIRKINKHVTPVVNMNNIGSLLSGDAIVAIKWSSAISNIMKSGILNEFAIYPLPRLNKHIRQNNILDGECIAISKNTSHPKLARKFIRFIMSIEIQKKLISELWWPPNRMDVRGDLNENYMHIYEQAMREELLHANPVPVDWYPNIVVIFNSIFNDVTNTDQHIGTIISNYRKKLVKIRRKKE